MVACFDEIDPKFDNYPQLLNTWLVVKSNSFHNGKNLFSRPKIKITNEGHIYIGGLVCKKIYLIFCHQKINECISHIELLSKVTATKTQAIVNS